MPAHSSLTGNGFVKHDLADRLRTEIMNGSLPRGVRIVEGKWAQKFGERREIGRAACRGRGEISGGGGSLKKKKRGERDDRRRSVVMGISAGGGRVKGP